jgi:hypothetical protein
VVEGTEAKPLELDEVGAERKSRNDSSSAERESRRSAATMPERQGEPDSLFGDDDLEDERGPEWCVDSGEEIKAMNKFELWLALGSGDFSPATLVWKLGRERWQPAGEIPELACALTLHAQTLMAAARVANDVRPDDAPANAITPGPVALDFDEAAELDQTPTAMMKVFARAEMGSLDGTTVSERPPEQLYLVRKMPRSVYGGRRRLFAGLLGSASAVPPVPLPPPPKPVRLEPHERRFGLYAAAATFVIFAFSATAPRHPSERSPRADMAAAFAPPNDTAEAPRQYGPPPSSFEGAAPTAQPSADTSASFHARHVKTVSPSKKGQERARKRAR